MATTDERTKEEIEKEFEECTPTDEESNDEVKEEE